MASPFSWRFDTRGSRPDGCTSGTRQDGASSGRRGASRRCSAWIWICSWSAVLLSGPAANLQSLVQLVPQRLKGLHGSLERVIIQRVQDLKPGPQDAFHCADNLFRDGQLVGRGVFAGFQLLDPLPQGGGLGLGLVQPGLRLFGTLGPPAGDVVRVSALHLDGPGLQLLDAGGLGAELVAGLRQGVLGGTAAFFCFLGCFFCRDPSLVRSLAALLFIGQQLTESG